MLDLSPQELISLNKIKTLGRTLFNSLLRYFNWKGKTKYTTTKVVGVLEILL